MPEYLAVLTADTHLRDRAWVGRRSLAGDAYFAFSQIVEAALDRRLPILAAGDVIDRRRNDSDVVHFLRQKLDALHAAELSFVFVQGQHDLQPVPWLSAIDDRVIHLEQHLPFGYEFPDGWRAMGFDWRPMDRVGEIFETVERQHAVDLLVLHQVVQEFMGSRAPAEMAIASLPKVERVLVGDYHEHLVRRTYGADGQELAIWSPGSTCLQAIDEPAEKYFFLLRDDFTVESVPLATRPYFYPGEPIMTADALQRLVDRLPEIVARLRDENVHLPDPLRDPIVRVEYLDELPGAYKQLCEAVDENVHLFLKPIRRPKTAEERPSAGSDGEEIRWGPEEMLACLAEVVDPNKEPAVFGAARRLLLAEDPRKEIAALRAEAGLEDASIL